MAEKMAQYDRVKEITDQLEAGIAELFQSDQYMQWLTTMSRFHDYSLNNTIRSITDITPMKIFLALQIHQNPLIR